MRSDKRKRLEAKGWKVGSAQEFLELSPEEAQYIEIKLALSRRLKDQRQKRRLSQVQAAQLIQSSQSRIAKMEAGDSSVSLDLLVKSLLALGATKADVAKSITNRNAA